jgi:hypothetical protein
LCFPPEYRSALSVGDGKAIITDLDEVKRAVERLAVKT